ncbi:MAG TPA: hypothetical protein VM733_05035 [Thermoanaerobaculia bacterium]|nr:hypothetical protein [Thermoanaerobaculia bacterium]
MTALLELPPFGDRDDTALLAELVATTRHHLDASPEYRRIWPDWRAASSFAELPFLHAGVFKHLLLASEGTSRMRTLVSSGTAGAQSRITMDAGAAALQAASSQAILADFIGAEKAPLLILDHASSLRSRDAIPARIAAAMSLQPFASEMFFVLDSEGAVDWRRVADALMGRAQVRIYAITSLLWTAWHATMPADMRASLKDVRIDFVHSGGWKKLEALAVDRATLDRALLEDCAPSSRVVDFYGLVEQNGVIYPLCDAGFRHAPAWSEVLVRDPFTLEVLASGEGLLQVMNPIPRGAPSHNVLTEDVGRVVDGPCPCGRRGRRFELIGRLPKAELRGCANV